MELDERSSGRSKQKLYFRFQDVKITWHFKFENNDSLFSKYYLRYSKDLKLQEGGKPHFY